VNKKTLKSQLNFSSGDEKGNFDIPSRNQTPFAHPVANSKEAGNKFAI
jgi:hypothetical protein